MSVPRAEAARPPAAGALRDDVAALAALERRATSAGERAAAEWIASRLRAIGAQHVRLLDFRSQSSWAPAHLAHALLGLVAVAARSRPLAAAAAVSYEADVSGRSQWLRRLLPAGTGTTVEGRIASAGRRTRTLVLVAHHDAAQAALVWHPRAVAANRAWSQRSGRSVPSHALPLAGLLLAAAGARRAAAGVLAASVAAFVEAAASATVPAANDNATGVAAVLCLAERLARDPLPDTDVVLVFPGAEEVGNAGMHAWVATAAQALDRGSTLVVNLDAIGSGEQLVVSRREGLTGWFAPADVDLALAAAADAGVALRPVAFPNVSDGFAARRAGLRSISILSYDRGWVANLHRPSDTPDNVRFATVEDAVALTEAIVRRWR